MLMGSQEKHLWRRGKFYELFTTYLFCCIFGSHGNFFYHKGSRSDFSEKFQRLFFSAKKKVVFFFLSYILDEMTVKRRNGT